MKRLKEQMLRLLDYWIYEYVDSTEKGDNFWFYLPFQYFCNNNIAYYHLPKIDIFV